MIHAADSPFSFGPSAFGASQRRLWSLAVGFLLTLVIGDVVLSRVPFPRVYGSRNETRQKWALLEDSPLTPDVVFLGCSYEWCGISPKVIDQAAGAGLGRPVRSLNLASSASSVWTQSLMVRRLTRAGRLPKVVYLGVSTEALRGDSGRAWFVNGLRALGETQDIVDAAAVNGDILWEAVLTGLFGSYHRWEDARIMAHRVVIGAPLVPVIKLRTDERGWGEWTGAATRAVDATSGSTGAGSRAKRMSDVGIAEVNLRSLRRSIERLREAGVVVRLVDMPMPNAAGVDDRTCRIDEELRVASSEARVRVVRGDESTVAPDDFFDQGHLNALGAVKFSRWLAEDVVEALREWDAGGKDRQSPLVERS